MLVFFRNFSLFNIMSSSFRSNRRLQGKIIFKMVGLTFSSKLNWGSYIISIAKTASKKVEGLIHSMKSLSPEVALYLCESTIRPCMEYFCHIWAGALSWNGWINYKNRYAGMLVLHLLLLLNPCFIV